MSEEEELSPGAILGGLEVVGVLGRGGFAIVYEVLRDGQPLAMKVMKRKHIAKKDTVSRFFREAEVIRGLESPHLPTIHDVGELEGDGRPFILMDRLEGRSVRDVLKDRGQILPARACKMAAQVCTALALAHERGALHRDLKPANLFVVNEGSEDEHIMLLDYGVATFVAGFTDRYGALTKTNAIVGTPHYMSPEQIHAKVLDARSDVYMLGAVLYELVTGTRPFDGETLGLLLSAVHSGVYKPVPRYAPETPKALVAIIDKALSREPDDRFADALDMRDALLKAKDAPLETAPRPSRRPTMPAGKAGVTAITAETLDETPDRLPARLAESTESIRVPRPPSRLPMLIAVVVVLLAIGFAVQHFGADEPVVSDVVAEEPAPPIMTASMRAEPEPMPVGVNPPSEAPTDTEDGVSMDVVSMGAVSMAAPSRMHPAMRRHSMEATETMEPVPPVEQTEMTSEPELPSADMRGELLNPF